MSTIHEIEQAIRALGPQDLTAFRSWFAAFDAAAWDRQLEEDEAAGRLDRFAEEALRDLAEGRCRDLGGIGPTHASGPAMRRCRRTCVSWRTVVTRCCGTTIVKGETANL